MSDIVTTDDFLVFRKEVLRILSPLKKDRNPYLLLDSLWDRVGGCRGFVSSHL